MLIVGCDKNGEWHLLRPHRINHLQSAEFWHLHVEKYQVRAFPLNRVHCGYPVFGFQDVADLRVVAEKIDEPLPCRLFIIDNQDADLLKRGWSHGSPLLSS